MLYLPLPKAHISSPSTAAVLDLAAQGPGWRKLRNTSSMCHGRWNDRKDRCLPYYNRPTQDGLRGHFVLRAIGKRFRKDRTAGCEKVVGIRFALDSSLEGRVSCELVSENAKFPASWEYTGNFIDSGAAKNDIKSVPYGPIP